MQFLPSPEPDPPPPAPERRWWLPALIASAVVAALATRWPWIRVEFENLFNRHHGPPGWHTTAGFTCLCTAALVTVMALAETRTPSSRQAVRPGSVMLVALATATLMFELLAGPGTLRGVSATWTPWFFVACAAVPVLLLTCLQRWRALRAVPGRSPDPGSPDRGST